MGEKKLGLDRKLEEYAKNYCGLIDGNECIVNIDDFEKDTGRRVCGNGCKIRPGNYLHKKYILENIKEGNRVIAIKFKGFKDEASFNQSIRKDILDYWRYEYGRSVLSGMPSTPSNPIEVDHKDGCKNSERISDIKQQCKEDFQTLLKNENDAKRQDCKVCRQEGIRPPASKILPEGSYCGLDYLYGDEHYDETTENPCFGCCWQDIVLCMRKNIEYYSEQHNNNKDK